MTPSPARGILLRKIYPIVHNKFLFKGEGFPHYITQANKPGSVVEWLFLLSFGITARGFSSLPSRLSHYREISDRRPYFYPSIEKTGLFGLAPRRDCCVSLPAYAGTRLCSSPDAYFTVAIGIPSPYRFLDGQGIIRTGFRQWMGVTH